MLQSDVFPFKFEVIHKSEITTFEASGFVLNPGFYWGSNDLRWLHHLFTASNVKPGFKFACTIFKWAIGETIVAFQTRTVTSRSAKKTVNNQHKPLQILDKIFLWIKKTDAFSRTRKIFGGSAPFAIKFCNYLLASRNYKLIIWKIQWHPPRRKVIV